MLKKGISHEAPSTLLHSSSSNITRWSKTLSVSQKGIHHSSISIQHHHSYGQTNNEASPGSSIQEDGRPMCGYCGKTFKYRFTLTEHIASHEGRDRYYCDMCDRGFQRKAHFEGHMNTHMNRRPHHCEFCGKSFAYKQALRSHCLCCKSRQLQISDNANDFN